MGIIRFAINNPVKIAVGVILLTLFGLLSITRIPIQLTPNVDRPIITVATFWEGASPQEIEREIVDRQEEKLKSVSNLKEMTSTSTENQAEITLEFHVGADKDIALRDVSDKLRQVTGYPEDMEEPTVTAADAALDAPIAWLIFFAASGEEPAKLKDFVEDEVKPILERAEGVAEVNVYGGMEREVQIRVDAARMAARQITFRDLEEALRQQNENISAGTISSGKRDYTWRTIGQFETTEQVLNTVVAHREGVPVYVHEIATVVKSFKKQLSFVRSVGQPVLALPVRRETGSNVIEVMRNLKVQIQKVNEEILSPLKRELRLTQVYDETIYIHSAINLVINNLLYGGGLAVLVLILFLRSPSGTGIVALCIPISVIGSFLVVTMLGRTLNVIMLAGMAFAVGMVVDNSIVVLENIYRHQQMGKSRREAALDGTVEVWGAVLASTLTTMAVFLPVVFIEEEAGQLFRDIAIAISAAVGLSLLVAVLVIPTVSARLLHANTTNPLLPGRWVEETINTGRWGETASKRRFSHLANLLAALTHRINGSFTARIVVCVGLVALSLLGSWALLTPTDYLPSGNRNLVFGFLITPPGYSLAEFRRMGTVIESVISPYWDPVFADTEDPQTKEKAQRLKAALDHKWLTEVVPKLEDQLARATDDLEQARQAHAQSLSRETLQALQDAEGQVFKLTEKLRSYRFPPPPIENFFFVSFGGGCFMGATSRDETVVKPLVHLLETAGERVPGTFAFFNQTSLFSTVRNSGNNIELEIRGHDLEGVTAVAGQLFAEVMKYFDRPRPNPGNFNLGRPEIQIIPDRVRAAEVGLNVRDVGQIVEACVDGAFVQGGFRDQGDEIDLEILVQGLHGATINEVVQTPIFSPVGGIILLSSVVNIVNTTAPQQINHIEEMPAITLEITPPEDMPLEQATTVLEEKIIAPMRAQGRIPNDIFTVAAGNVRKLDQTRTAMFGKWNGFNLESIISVVTSRGGLAILITYLLMSALFESFAYPFVIMITVAPATVGGFAALHITHWQSIINPVIPTQNLDVLTMLGFVILVGIVVNNAILLVHQALTNIRVMHMNPQDAISESVRTRVRPIFMTALTSVFGMLPLVVMRGAGSELYRGLGSVVVGGLLVSTLFTLILVPALLSLSIDLRRRLLNLLPKGHFAEPASDTGIGSDRS